MAQIRPPRVSESGWATRNNLVKLFRYHTGRSWFHLIIGERKVDNQKVLRLKKYLNWFSISSVRELKAVIRALERGAEEVGWDLTDAPGSLDEAINDADELQKISKRLAEKKHLLKAATIALKQTRDQKNIQQRELNEIEQLENESRIFVLKKRLDELNERLERGSYSETTGSSSWQKWIYKNSWLFGRNYGSPIEKSRVGFNSIPDYIFPTFDGFIDILEIKLPSHEVVVEDSSHPGSFRWSNDASKAIGQVVNYLHEIEQHQLLIQDKLREKYPDLREVFVIKPRAIILVGNKRGWPPSKVKALRKLNYSLHGIEVITYDELEKRGQDIINFYTKEQ